jgi:sulfur carrier protein ThiS adenylyltransferase
MMARHTPGVHERLKQGRIGIAGLGGLGSHVALALARVGIGYMHLVDYDIVEPSNLNRQQYFIDQLGQPKVEALKTTLERINPSVDIHCTQAKVTEDTVQTIFSDIDILVEAFDSAAEKSMLINHFLKIFPGKTIIAASGVAGHETSNGIKTSYISKNLIICGDGATAARPGCGLMAPRVGIAAHHQANAVVRILLDESAG